MKHFKQHKRWQLSLLLLILIVVGVAGGSQVPAVQDELLRQQAQLHQQAVTELETMPNQALLFPSGSYVKSSDRLQQAGPLIPYEGWLFYEKDQPDIVRLVQFSAQHQYQYLVPDKPIWCLGDRVLVQREKLEAEAELRSLVLAPDTHQLSLGLAFTGAYPPDLLNPLAKTHVYLLPLRRKIVDLWVEPRC
jgi:hypothetical protein